MGKVNAEGTKLDQYTFAQNAEILDVSDGRGAAISPQRLAGLNLGSGKVRWYSRNPQGEIDAMILNDVTGDACQYGMITRFQAEGEGAGRMYSYEYDLGGAGYGVSGGLRCRAESGAIRIQGDPSSPERLHPLTSVGPGHIAGNKFVAGNQKYTLSDSVVVYEFRGGKYFLSTLARAEESGGAVTGWYDRPEQEGGRIRVIVVK